MNDVYLHQNEKYRYDRYHVIEDKILTNAMVKYLQNFLFKANAVKSLTELNIPTIKQFKQAVKKLKKNLRFGSFNFKPSLPPLSSSQVSITPLLGFGGRRNKLNKTIYELVRNTQTAVTIFTPYFNFPGNINRAVKRLLKNGKQVPIDIEFSS